MEKFSFYFAQDKTHLPEEEKIRPLKLKEYNLSFNNNPVFCDASEFALTNYTNDMMLGHFQRLSSKLIFVLNRLNFTDYRKASETLPLNRNLKNTFDIDIYGNVLLTSFEFLNPEVSSLVVNINLLSKQNNSLQLNNGHWEKLKKILWSSNLTGQKYINENNKFMKLRANGFDMCYGYLFFTTNINADEALSTINQYVESASSKLLKHDKFVLFYTKRLSEIPNFDLKKLNKKADYIYIFQKNNILQQIIEMEFEIERMVDDWLDL